jgi:transposase
MGRPLRIAWQDEAATLRQWYQHERDGPVRTRLHALWLLREGHGLAETATTVGVAYRTVQQWLAWYRAGGVAEVRTDRKAGRGQLPRLSPAQQAQVVAHTAAGECFTVQDTVDWVREQFGVVYTRKGMYTLLARHHCHPKVPRPINPKTTPEAQEGWKKGAWRRR